MSKTTVAARIAQLLAAIENCQNSGNLEWLGKHKEALRAIERELPSGSGIDNGTRIDKDSTPERIILTAEFHHMNEAGMYDGWTHHRITVRASLLYGLGIRIGGRGRNDIKDYLHQVYSAALSAEAL